MKLIESKTVNISIKLFSAVAVLAMAVVAVTVYKASALNLLVFFAFLLFYVQLPGLLIMRILGIRLDHISSNIIVGFFSGWAHLMLWYFITDLIGTNVLLYAVCPLCSVAYLILIFKSRKTSYVIGRFKLSGLSTAFCIFFVLVLLFAMLRTQYLYLNPAVAEYTYMNPDKAYHMGLINSLAYDFPIESPWVKGRTISYHVFTEILYAVSARLFGLESGFLLMSCGPWMTAYVIGLSFYSFFREMCGRKERAGKYALLVFLSNMWLSDNWRDSLAFRFAFVNENAAGYSIGGAMAFIILLKHYRSRIEADGRSVSKATAGEMLLVTAFIMLLTGIKGPVGIVMLGAMWGTYVLGLIMKKVRFADIIPLAVMSAGFVTVYLTVLGSKGQTNAGGNSIFAVANITNICFWKSSVIATMKNLGLPLYVRLGVVLLVFMIFMLSAYFLPFCIGYIRELILVLSRKKDFDYTRIVVYAAALLGLGAMFILNYSGHSQVYFGFIPAFFAPLISYWLFEDLEEKKASGQSKSALLRILRFVFILTIIATTISLGFCFKQFFHEAKAHANPDEYYNDVYLTVTDDEYEAMEWISHNTPEDALIATDRYYSTSPEVYSYKDRWTNRFFLYAVYSDRFCYIAGSGYNLPAEGWVIRKKMIEKNLELYDPDNPYRGDAAREIGVSYVVVSKRFTTLPSLANDDYELVFTNDEVDIYHITAKSGNGNATVSDITNASVIPVFAYHRLGDARDDEYWNDEEKSSLILPVNTFEEQMKYLADNGYTTLSMDEYYRWYKGELTVPEKSVVITFDDGNYSVIKFGLPTLEKYNIKATVFMIGSELTDITDTSRTEGDSFYMMGRDVYDATRLEYPGLEFQSHTYNLHRTEGSGERALVAASPEELAADCEEMYNDFGCEYLAYPFGATTDAAIDVIKTTHVKMAFAYGDDDYSSAEDNQYNIPRIKVSALDTPDVFYRWLQNALVSVTPQR